MRRGYRGFFGSVVCLSLGLAGCETMPPPTSTTFVYKNYAVADGSASPAKGITCSSTTAR